MKKLHTILIFLVSLTLLGCSADPNEHRHGVYMLLDTSGTYTKELTKAQNIINYTLAKMNPGDAFAVASIDTGSFSEKDIWKKATFDDRPSMANQQKRDFKATIDKKIKEVKSSRFTDITGGILQAIEYLNEKDPGKKTILIFSDMKEELGKGYVRDEIPLNLEGVEVIALNVTKLKSDNFDPREYMDRLAKWKERVVLGGGEWRIYNDLERLEKLFM